MALSSCMRLLSLVSTLLEGLRRFSSLVRKCALFATTPRLEKCEQDNTIASRQCAVGHRLLESLPDALGSVRDLRLPNHPWFV